MNSETYLEIWNRYQSAWGPISDAYRRELLDQSVENDIIYTDLASQVQSVEALVERIAASQTQYTGSHFRNDSFLEHHGQGLFHWTMYDVKGAVFVKGSSFGRFGDDGRLVQATGFFKAPRPKRASALPSAS